MDLDSVFERFLVVDAATRPDQGSFATISASLIDPPGTIHCLSPTSPPVLLPRRVR